MDQTQALQNLLNGTASEEEINLLKHGLISGEISSGGNFNQSVVIIGNTAELPLRALVLLTQLQKQTRRLHPSLNTNPKSLISDHAHRVIVEALDISFNPPGWCIRLRPIERESIPLSVSAKCTNAIPQNKEKNHEKVVPRSVGVPGSRIHAVCLCAEHPCPN
jgi:hypothetical protein